MKYIALTIGPIDKTLGNAKKTRELWGGSYIFSYIMKNIIQKFSDREFVVPYTKDETIFSQQNGVGLFHDRFIFKSHNGDAGRLETVIDDVLSEVANNIKAPIDFVRGYFQINFLEYELGDNENPIHKLSPLLDSKELFFKVSQYDKNHLQEFLKNRLNSSFLVKDAFSTKRTSFASLSEISTKDLCLAADIFNNDDDDDNLFESISQIVGEKLRPYHKYIAIVNADGDSLNAKISRFTQPSDYENFSKKLFEFATEANELIKGYGGQTVFAGGDDLLFFAPVLNSGDSIFDLIDKLSKLFSNKLDGSTISFGVSITYYKYPLYEALGQSKELLYQKAKQGKKNAIAYSVTKHSGQTFEALLKRGEVRKYEMFLKLIATIVPSSESDLFLHSIYTKIDKHRAILMPILDNAHSLSNFFNNFFNEDEHKKYKDFFATLISFIVVSNDLDYVYSTLRFIKFAKGDK